MISILAATAHGQENLVLLVCDCGNFGGSPDIVHTNAYSRIHSRVRLVRFRETSHGLQINLISNSLNEGLSYRRLDAVTCFRFSLYATPRAWMSLGHAQPLRVQNSRETRLAQAPDGPSVGTHEKSSCMQELFTHGPVSQANRV